MKERDEGLGFVFVPSTLWGVTGRDALVYRKAYREGHPSSRTEHHHPQGAGVDTWPRATPLSQPAARGTAHSPLSLVQSLCCLTTWLCGRSTLLGSFHSHK